MIDQWGPFCSNWQLLHIITWANFEIPMQCSQIRFTFWSHPKHGWIQLVILLVNEVVCHVETDKRPLCWWHILNQLSTSSSCLLWFPARAAPKAAMWADFRHKGRDRLRHVSNWNWNSVPGNTDPCCLTVHNEVFLRRAEIVNVTRELYLNDLYISCEVTDWWSPWSVCRNLGYVFV